MTDQKLTHNNGQQIKSEREQKINGGVKVKKILDFSSKLPLRFTRIQKRWKDIEEMSVRVRKDARFIILLLVLRN